jgi:phosphomethylpyrimidine synthase
MSRGHWEWLRQTDHRSARRALLPGGSSVNITEDVRKYAAEQGLAEEEALKAGMAEKATEFNESGAELYAKA